MQHKVQKQGVLRTNKTQINFKVLNLDSDWPNPFKTNKNQETTKNKFKKTINKPILKKPIPEAVQTCWNLVVISSLPKYANPILFKHSQIIKS